MSNNTQGLEKKQRLLLEYFHLIGKLEKDRTAVTAKITKAKNRFEELLETDANPAQLAIFDNMDEYLADEAVAA